MAELKNVLINESSPYLLQHAMNPVEWQPWSSEALALAKQYDKPILLSIGYSACHWCHVMAHESFADKNTAKLMNEGYINIKVDREERPDIDKIYQTSYQIMAQKAGGWPLTMFLDPQTLVPFFGGTYFPKTAKYGLPNFNELLENLAIIYKSKKPEIKSQISSISSVLAKLNPPTDNHSLTFDETTILNLFNTMLQSFDAEHGGFGSAPKFPTPSRLDFLLQFYHYFTAIDKYHQQAQLALDSTIFTLKKMSDGGLYDHIGGGFFRYSTDQTWQIPHFEKMLYDNALLLNTLADTTQILNNKVFIPYINGITHWAERYMKSPQGGYFSAIDADSEGQEGLFYVWDKSELELILTEQEFAVITSCLASEEEPNFEQHWHLFESQSIEQTAEKLSIGVKNAQKAMLSAKAKLQALRSQRIHPLVDDKILCSWNALYIKGLAKVAKVLKDEKYINDIFFTLDFIHDTLWDGKQLLANYKPNGHSYNAYLDDYAFLLDALISVLQIKFRYKDLLWAAQLANVLIEQFADNSHGGFYFTSHQHEKFIHRTMTYSDEAIPCGNGVAIKALFEIGHLLANNTFINTAEKAINRILPILSNDSQGNYSVTAASIYQLTPPELIIIHGTNQAEIKAWQTLVQKTFHPTRLCFAINSTTNDDLITIEDIPNYLISARSDRTKTMQTIAYICQGTSCSEPVTSLQELAKRLSISETKT